MEEVKSPDRLGLPVAARAEPYQEHYDLVKVILNDRDKLVLKQKARCDEVSHKAVFIMEIILFVIQIIFSAVYLGSWATLFAVRLPRLVVTIVTRYHLDRFQTRLRKLQVLKVELAVRVATFVGLLAFSYGFCTWLPEKFCEMFYTAPNFAPTRFSTCKWQVFGIRIVTITLFLPIEVIMLIVVRRHTSDMLFNIKLKGALTSGESELQIIIKEQKEQLAKEVKH
jgi:hypothetical protein